MSIEKIEIKNSQLEIYYKGGSACPTPPKGWNSYNELLWTMYMVVNLYLRMMVRYIR